MTVAMLSSLIFFHEIRHEFQFFDGLMNIDVVIFGIIVLKRMLSFSCINAKRDFLLYIFLPFTVVLIGESNNAK